MEAAERALLEDTVGDVVGHGLEAAAVMERNAASKRSGSLLSSWAITRLTKQVSIP